MGPRLRGGHWAQDHRRRQAEREAAARGDRVTVSSPGPSSLQEFVKDAGSYSRKLVDDLLDQITGGDHSRLLFQLRQVGVPRRPPCWAARALGARPGRRCRPGSPSHGRRPALARSSLSWLFCKHLTSLQKSLKTREVVSVEHRFAVSGGRENLGFVRFSLSAGALLRSQEPSCVTSSAPDSADGAFARLLFVRKTFLLFLCLFLSPSALGLASQRASSRPLEKVPERSL